MWEEADADYISYKTLARRLRERFGLKFQEERYQTELRTRRRGKKREVVVAARRHLPSDGTRLPERRFTATTEDHSREIRSVLDDSHL